VIAVPHQESWRLIPGERFGELLNRPRGGRMVVTAT
jgi:hypothetical protein